MIERRIFGPPGTGKTTALTRELEELSRNYTPDKILVSSFTKAAASNIASRALTIPEKQVGTLHAHCYRALGTKEIVDLKRKKYKEAWKSSHPALPMSDSGGERGDQLLNELMLSRATMKPKEAWTERVQKFNDIWEEFKTEHGALDFQDLIDKTYENFSEFPGKPEVMVIDEAQDFSRSEHALINKLTKDMKLVIKAGDDDQTIYEFKGADPSGFIDGDYEKEVLAQSYRIPSAVHAAAEQWIRRVSNRAEKEYRPREEEGLVLRTPYGWDKPKQLIADAAKYAEDGKKVMFLTSCDYMLFPLLKELRAEAIPFHNPYALDRANGWNPLQSRDSEKCGAERLLDFLLLDNDVHGDHAQLWRPHHLNSWLPLIKVDGILKRGAKSYIDRLCADPAGAMRKLDIMDLLQFFEEDALRRAMEGDLDWFERNLLGSKEKSMRYPLYVAKKMGGKHLKEEPNIIVGTIHSVKGGEADVVYLFPDLSPKGGDSMRASQFQRDATTRTFYVGMTRTKEILVMGKAVSRRDRVW